VPVRQRTRTIRRELSSSDVARLLSVGRKQSQCGRKSCQQDALGHRRALPARGGSNRSEGAVEAYSCHAGRIGQRAFVFLPAARASRLARRRRRRRRRAAIDLTLRPQPAQRLDSSPATPLKSRPSAHRIINSSPITMSAANASPSGSGSSSSSSSSSELGPLVPHGMDEPNPTLPPPRAPLTLGNIWQALKVRSNLCLLLAGAVDRVQRGGRGSCLLM
jgi:hypothetical protein